MLAEPVGKRQRGRKKGSKNKGPSTAENENTPIDVNAPRPKRLKAVQAVHAATVAAKKGPVLTASTLAGPTNERPTTHAVIESTAVTNENLDSELSFRY